MASVKRKLQVFISSTYEDLKQERQAAVEAILASGNIPAGMELFAAGDKSQLAVIRKWIDDSDVFMLILGGRYGSIEPESNRSYVRLEYEYAVGKNKPYFAVVLDDAPLKALVDAGDPGRMETERPDDYTEFRRVVRSKICKPYSDPKDIKLAVHESLAALQDDARLVGWVPGSVLGERNDLARERETLAKQVNDLAGNLKKLQEERQLSFNGLSFSDLKVALFSTKLAVPPFVQATGPDGKRAEEIDLLNFLVSCSALLSSGVDNSVGGGKAGEWLFSKASMLVKYGVVDVVKGPARHGTSIIRATALGNRFLAGLEKERSGTHEISGDHLQFAPLRETSHKRPPT